MSKTNGKEIVENVIDDIGSPPPLWMQFSVVIVIMLLVIYVTIKNTLRSIRNTIK